MRSPRAEYGPGVATLCFELSANVHVTLARVLLVSIELGVVRLRESASLPSSHRPAADPGGILLAKARAKTYNHRLPTAIHFSRLSASRPLRKTRHRYVDQPVWKNSRGDLPRQAAYRNRAPRFFQLPPYWIRRLPSLYPFSPLLSSLLSLGVFLFFIPHVLFLCRVGACNTSVEEACAVIGVGYGPGTRSFHITFHFITHAYEGHNLHC